MMYNTQLETFLKVAESGSFSKTAELLYITPPAVTKQINLLEEDLGLTLFVRTHRGLKLTPAGQSLYKDTSYLITYCAASLERARNATSPAEKTVRIGVSPMTPQPLVDVWPEIQRRCPDIRFQMIPFSNTPANAKNILKNLGQNIDVLGGIFDDTFLKQRQCAGTRLSMEPLCCAVSLYHPLASKKILEIEDIYGRDLLMMQRGWNTDMDGLRDYLTLEHPQVHIVDFDFYDMEVFNRCESDKSVLIGIRAWKNDHPMMKMLDVNWDYKVPYGLLHAEKPAPAVMQFVKAMKTALNATQ